MSLKLDTILVGWGVWAVGHRWKTLLIALLITAAAAVGFSFLHLEMTFYSILPRSSAKVDELKRITEEFPSASNIILVIEGDDPIALRSAVDAVTKELSADQYNEIIRSVRGRTDIEAFSDSILLLQAGENAVEKIPQTQLLPQPLLGVPVALVSAMNQELHKLLADLDLTSLEKNQINEGLLSLHRFLDAFYAGDQIEQVNAFQEIINDILIPEPYFINDAQNMALVFIQPDFTVDDWSVLPGNIQKIEAGISQYEEAFNVSMGLTGLLVVAKDEVVTSKQGLFISVLLAFVLILIILVLNFRMTIVPIVAGIPLVVGIFWTAGTAGFLLGRLNIMTAMYMVALLGLGVDFAIHYLTAFLQERETGKTFQESVKAGIEKSGRGVVIGALTTSAAFIALLIADSALVRELAVIAGIGIVCELLSMIILLPALLSFRDSWIRKYNRKDSIVRMRSEVSVIGLLGSMVSKIPLIFLITFLVVTVFLSLYSPKISVESNIMNMEADGLESVILQERMIRKFGRSPDSLYIYSESLAETRHIVGQLKNSDLIKEVDSFISFIPDSEQQRELKESLEQVILSGSGENGFANPENLNENQLQQLQLEIGIIIDNLRLLARRAGYPGQVDLINKLNGVFAETQIIMKLYQELAGFIIEFIDKQIRADFITVESLPDQLRESYFNRDGSVNLITIIPKENIWEKENREALYAELVPITDKFTGMVMAADQMNRIVQEDGARAAIVAIAVIFIILLLDFRNIKLAFLTIVPLLASLSALLGAMVLLGIKFDFINIITVPLLIGIGIDDAVHISHRYRIEGSGRMEEVIQKIGRALLIAYPDVGISDFILWI
ncbi:MAG: MMPL family transporter [Bacteroidetes bacterium]|nr:MMPL family transporter [Bacteroidota bacterium]